MSNLVECKEHKAEHGRLPDDMSEWINEQRKLSQKKRQSDVQKQRIRLLRDNGILGQPNVEDAEDWGLSLQRLVEYVVEHKQLPRTNTVLGKWMTKQRGIAARNSAIGGQQSRRMDRLRELGFLKSHKEVKWDCMYKALKDFIQHTTEKKWPSAGPLNNWVKNQRQSYFKGKLSDEKTNDLNSIGIEWFERSHQIVILNELLIASHNGRQLDAFLKRAEQAGYSRKYLHQRMGSNVPLKELFQWRGPVWKGDNLVFEEEEEEEEVEEVFNDEEEEEE